MRQLCGVSSARSSTKLLSELCGNLWDCRLKRTRFRSISLYPIGFSCLFAYFWFGLYNYIKVYYERLCRAFLWCAIASTRDFGVVIYNI